ncbi:MAG TPA: guanosine monophosphate reductase [Candidatus Nanoarchaeia archaeon]|nr:guanosine monophosphate reductase [Candidatus Nanoarchaeia archaeon]
MARIIGKGYSFDDVLINPKYNKIKSRKEVDFKTKVTKNYSLDMPLIAANMDTVCESEMAIAIGKLGGLGVIHRFMTIEKQVEEIKKVKFNGLVSSAAIGVRDYKERAERLVNAGVNILVLDVAHGHSKKTGKVLDWIKENFSVDVMVGNVATKDAAHYFLTKGADAIKVGIGPGSMCTTRKMTGAGVPQITAIMDVYEETQGRVPVCADGGIKFPGDMVKAIGSGADTVMSGSLFAGTTESPGEIIKKQEKEYKKYRGMASYDATLKRLKLDGKKANEIISVEGEIKEIEHKGSIEPIVKKYLGGLASGMTYTGAGSIEEISGKADFIEISQAGYRESIAHGNLD